VHPYKGALLHRDVQSHKDAHTKACTHTKVGFYREMCIHAITQRHTHTITYLREQVWDLPRGQQIVDVHQHALIHDLGVSEQEHDALALQARSLVQLLQVLLEVVDLCVCV